MPSNIEFDGDITSIAELLESINSAGLADLNHAHIRSWFRGQSDSSWDLSPGVYRVDFNTSCESDRLRKERHLAQDFRALSAGLVSGSKSNADYYFLQQHYRMPTRLLDWTTSSLAALHFAVDPQTPSDAALFMMDAYVLTDLQGAKWPDGRPFRGVSTSRNPLFEEALLPIFEWKDVGHFPKFILPIRPDNFDRRISLQRGCFTFHPPGKEEITKSMYPNLKVYRVPSTSKRALKNELGLLGVDQFSIFGDLDHLAEHLKFAHGIFRKP